MKWRSSKGLRVREDGARVECVQTSRAGQSYWKAYHANGEPVRVDTLPNGQPYQAQPWHGPQDKPLQRRFPSARFAMQIIDACGGQA